MSIEQLDDGRWRVRWRTPDGRRPQKTLRTKRAAEKYLRDRVDEAELGIGYVHRDQTWREFYPEWAAGKEPSVSVRSWEAYETHWRVHLDPMVGSQRVAEVSVERVQRLVNELTIAGKAPKTVRGITATWSNMIATAAARGRCKPLPKDRQSRAALPQVKRRKLVIPTVAEVARIADEIIAPLSLYVWICGTMGLRQGEALALHPGDVNWDRGQVWVHQQVVKTTGVRVEGTKEDAGAWVTMNHIVAGLLPEHMAEYPHPDWLFNHGRDARRPQFTASEADKAWRAACARAGVRGVRFHDLRHASASMMIRAGLNIKKVSTEMRHAEAGFTLQVYGHLFDDDREASRVQLDDALRAELASATGRVADAVPMGAA